MTKIAEVWRTYKCPHCRKIYLAKTQPICFDCKAAMLPVKMIFPTSGPAKSLEQDFENPVGTFQCDSCKDVFDGSQLAFNPALHVKGGWVCINGQCGGQVRKIADRPMAEHFSFAPGKSY